MSEVEIGTGPWRGPAGAVTFCDGVFHADAWLKFEWMLMKRGTFQTQKAAVRHVERWLERATSVGAKPRRK